MVNVERYSKCWVILLLGLFILSCFISGCDKKDGAVDEIGGIVKEQSNGLVNGTMYGGKMIEWSNDALQVSLNCPEQASIKLYPGEDEVLNIDGADDLDINLKIISPQAPEAEFAKYMEESFDKMPSYTGGFEEYQRKIFEINGHPAAYIEYKWNVMKRDFRVLELNVVNGDYQYELIAEWLLSNDDKYLPEAQAVFDSFRLLDGEPDLTAVKAEDGISATVSSLTTEQEAGDNPTVEGTTSQMETDQQVSTAAFALTKEACKEGLILNTINYEYSDQAGIADWADLKNQYGSQLPAALAQMGLGDKQAAWVVNSGQQFYSGSRHYFIQRFDSGKPSDFLAHDQVGSIYLGSWYNIDIPVLVSKKSTSSQACVLSQGSGTEGMALNIVKAEFGDKATIADWADLKNQYGNQLPSALAQMGLGDQQAAWVVNSGQQFYSGNRHYFIQRFDSGKPSSFLAHDQVGSIYLGSWYNINIPVLVSR